MLDSKKQKILFLFFIVVLPLFLSIKPAQLTESDVTLKMKEIMRAHASYKEFTPELAKRSLANFLQILDPAKTYLLEPEISKWQNPSDVLLNDIVAEFQKGTFSSFNEIYNLMPQCIERRNRLEEKILCDALPKNIRSKDFKDLDWAKTEEELYDRLKAIRALQMEATAKLDTEAQNTVLFRMQKRRLRDQEEFLTKDAALKNEILCTDILKAMASSLDHHTSYFTPSEASQFLVNVQQKLLGIGVQLRDDVDGYSIVKVVDGSPAALSPDLKLKDKIIAIDSVPVVGLDPNDVVDMIRGKEGTEVELTVIRETQIDDRIKKEKKKISVTRAEIVLKDARVDASSINFGDGKIILLHLFSFYQDQNTSSSEDLEKVFHEQANGAKVKGVVLDLRYNSGGILAQAVDVVSLFIKKGIVVSIKDENGHVQHLRGVNAKVMWDGPLVVLINRLSASSAEIVAGALQDYGRALIVGDDHSFGKGSFQSLTLNPDLDASIDPKGEYKVTRGRYYTVSGRTPQLVGVQSDIVVPSGLNYFDIGEKYITYPLTNDSIEPNFVDTFSDIAPYQREKVKKLYYFDIEKKCDRYGPYLACLKENSTQRIEANKAYKEFLESIKKSKEDPESQDALDANLDYQLVESLNVMRDLIWLQEFQSNSVAHTEMKKAA